MHKVEIEMMVLTYEEKTEMTGGFPMECQNELVPNRKLTLTGK